MKKSPLIKTVAAILMITLASACATPYFGKTYTATQNVDVYLDAKDVKKTYEVMGTSDVDQGFSSLDKLQQKVIELGKTKGADGVIMKLDEEVTGSTKNDFGTVGTGKKNNTYSGSSITTNTKVKKVKATFIKYR
ncbi:hypothetical protein [Pedobacter sp. UBA5917]|jgi:spore maturation protein SpmB|uniref:hypothetical protein n=1 Tax=Pedobacter sp. UBA5917 TaxID=1947061 RepID=UPI0025CF6973|nr:hypothetical protein [Pedobacter sp. UBA5917]